MKAHFKITPPLGLPGYLIRISGDNITLKTENGAKVELSWITNNATELEFSLADATFSKEALAALQKYVFPTWEVEEWTPVK
jgi:hypothetical protein